MTTFRAGDLLDFVNSRAAGRIGLILAALISAVYAAWFSSRPLYNWDIIPYVAVALRDAGHPADTLRQQTYEIMERSSPREAHEFLFGGSEFKKDTYNRETDYRYMVANISKIFADQLPLYTVKPAYPALMSLLVRAGLDPVTATMVVSGAAYAAICLSLCLDFSLDKSRHQPGYNGPAVPQSGSHTARTTCNTGFAVRLLAPVGNISRNRIPICRNRYCRVCSLISCRPENIIYVFIFAAYLLFTARFPLVKSLLSLGVALAVYFVQTGSATTTDGRSFLISLFSIGRFCKILPRYRQTYLTI